MKNERLKKIKENTLNDFKFVKSNTHVLDKNKYIKMITLISFEDVFYLIEQAKEKEELETMNKYTNSELLDVNYEWFLMREEIIKLKKENKELRCEIDKLSKA